MEIASYLSNNSYIPFPPFQPPKLYLAVDTPAIALNSLSLYRPFAKKAILVKSLYQLLAKLRLISVFSSPKSQSGFVSFLEDRLSKLKICQESLVLSTYMATDQDKLVIQIQDEQARIVGYLKIAQTPEGEKKIHRELMGMECLRTAGVPTLNILDQGQWGTNSFFLSAFENTQSRNIDEASLLSLLEKFHTGHVVPLSSHPRILQMLEFFRDQENEEYANLILRLSQSIERPFQVLFEHGDLAPWNLFQRGQDLVLYDLELCETEGLEWFDWLSFQFRIATHLDGRKGHGLQDKMLDVLPMERSEAKVLLILFLLKERMDAILFGRTHLIDIQDFLTLSSDL